MGGICCFARPGVKIEFGFFFKILYDTMSTAALGVHYAACSKGTTHHHSRERDGYEEKNAVEGFNGNHYSIKTLEPPTTDTSEQTTRNSRQPCSNASTVLAEASTNEAGGKTRKRFSPFRVKMGCVVALRHNAGKNNTSVSERVNSSSTNVGRQILPEDSFINVWVDPVPGRDESLSLIGKRIRCRFPRQLLGNDKKRRVLEGEVISLVDFSKRKPGKPWKVELLIDREMLQHFPFLTRMDEDVDMSQLPNDKARRNYRNELRMRGGANMVVVKMRLGHPGSESSQSTSNHVQWVIQKRIPTKLLQNRSVGSDGAPRTAAPAVNEKNGVNSSSMSESNAHANNLKKDQTSEVGDSASTIPHHLTEKRTTSHILSSSSALPAVKNARKRSRKGESAMPSCPASQSRHVGDGNDSSEQQVANWRWLVSRYHNLRYESSGNSVHDFAGDVSLLGLIGQVVKVEQPRTVTTTLALVTIKRLFLPEQTRTGRVPHHRKLELFQSAQQCDEQFIVPVEQLLVLGLRLQQGQGSRSDQDPTLDLFTEYTYSVKDGVYRRIEGGLGGGQYQVRDFPTEKCDSCHRCCRFLPETKLVICTNLGCASVASKYGPHWCSDCIQSCSRYLEEDLSSTSSLPCCRGACDCRDCKTQATQELYQTLKSEICKKSRKRSGIESETNKFFGVASLVLNTCKPVDFALDSGSLLDLLKIPAPAINTIKRVRAKNKGVKRWLLLKAQRAKQAKGDTDKEMTNPSFAIGEEDFTTFKPTCAREATFDDQKLMKRRMSFIRTESTDRPRNLRDGYRTLKTEANSGDKTSENRAARVKQRRIIKGVANVSALGRLDILASRESQLRFGRSGIHNWGVFADSDIAAGDLIVEYRGEIIGNARAEQREKEYENAKIGSDYMFRIDKDTVCDATKLGNVARFINASCDPNCYTKIITVDGDKRIVIYAKKDVNEGDELCYDYKFPLEYDPLKRIPCHCGAPNCRGFMNWDKRYV